MSTPANNIPAPSAAPAGAPAVAAPTPAPAPSAAAAIPNPVLSLQDYDRLASASLLANSTPEPQPATATPAPGQEPAPVAAPVADPNVPTADQQPNVGLAVSPTTSDDVPEVTPEELAQLNEPGQRALKAEREERKAAKAEARELKAKLAELEAKLSATPAVAKPPQDPAAVPAPAVTTPSVATPALADCNTFEAVEARALSAAQTEATVTELQTQLASQGHEAVAAQLAQAGIAKIGSTPIAEATPEIIDGFLKSAMAGARLTQAQVAPRTRFIAQQAESWKAATAVLPELNTVGSLLHKQVAALIQSNPMLKSYPNWPQIAAKMILGDQAFAKMQAPPAKAPAAPAKPAAIKPAPATIPPPVATALRAAPGAPATSSSALPQSKRLDELSAKLANGTASLTEVDEYGRMSLG